MADIKKNLLLLFEHPNEPIFTVRGDEPTQFVLPESYWTDEYKNRQNAVQNLLPSGKTARQVQIADLPNKPDLSNIRRLERKAPFSLFLPAHRQLASELIEIFRKTQSLEELQCTAVYVHDKVNSYLFIYALSVALLHHRDTKNVNLPSFVQCFPEKFVDSQIYAELSAETALVSNNQRRVIQIPSNYTASDQDVEHLLWYFREDLGVNLHHWHWHLVYPYNADAEIVDKDRRGELFYYMHQQIIARYNAERFCNGLDRVRPLNNFSEAIPEAYFPKMDSRVASRAWPPRQRNAVLQDVRRRAEGISEDVKSLERWSSAIINAINQGQAVRSDGSIMNLSNETGIDTLGNMVESSLLSPNPNLYGDLHNMGHVFISFVHDPQHHYLENFAVMGDVTTAMRDPVFYRWHAYIDDIFQRHKSLLPFYTEQQLHFAGITITSLQASIRGSNPNELKTFFKKSTVNLSRGVDFVPRGDIWVEFNHLQHTPFEFRITYNNTSGRNLLGMLRIFIAPQLDLANKRMQFRDQRLLMLELDKAKLNLSMGNNKLIVRSSLKSNVTIPFEQIFRRQQSTDSLEENFCGCGWPNYMLLPRGKPAGMKFDLFAMISDYAEDGIDPTGESGMCEDAVSYCGIRDNKYPDKRSMGYPFDRLPRPGVMNLSQFLTPNMAVVEVNITHIGNL